MATIFWRGDAPAIAQVSDFQFGGTWEATDVVNISINGKTLSVVAGSTVIATVVSTVVAAFNSLSASIYPEFAEITASVSPTGSAYLRLTADTAGKPFDVTVATTETGGGAADDQTIGSEIAVQASRGPAHVDDPLNYSGGALPANGDTLVVTDTTESLLYGLGALSAVTLDALIINQSFTGSIGLPEYDLENDYYQYRERYFCIGATEVTIGAGEGGGSGRIRLNLGSAQTTVNVFNSGQSSQFGMRSIAVKGTHADNEINILKGSVDIAPEQGSASTFKTVRCSYVDNPSNDVNARSGSGVTLTNVVQQGGDLVIQSNTTTINVLDGTCTLMAGDHASVDATGGIVDWRTTGEVAALSASNCTVDLSKDPRPKDFKSTSTIELYRGAVLNDPLGVLPSGCDVRDNTGGVTINRAPGVIYEFN